MSSRRLENLHLCQAQRVLVELLDEGGANRNYTECYISDQMDFICPVAQPQYNPGSGDKQWAWVRER